MERSYRGRLSCLAPHPSRASLNDEAGFSLIELLTVLALLGLASALVVPALQRALERRELRQSVLALAAVARNLRGRALAESAVQRLVVDASENSYEVLPGKKVALPRERESPEWRGESRWKAPQDGFSFFPTEASSEGRSAFLAGGRPAIASASSRFPGE